jgi:hypothetical protein
MPTREHLNRVHRIDRCPRCREGFPRGPQLQTHLRQPSACDVRDSIFNDDYDWGQGFDDEQYDELKLRLRGTENEEKWNRCYRILFPRDSETCIPSPCKSSVCLFIGKTHG